MTADPNAQIARAWALHRGGALEEAYGIYREVLAAAPDHPLALHYLGLLAQQSGQTHQAVALLERSVAVDASDARAFNHLGQAHLSAGNGARAVASFRRALEVDPAHVDSLNNLANTLSRTGALDEAIALYRLALEKKPDEPHAGFNLGRALSRRGDAAEAIPLLQNAIAADPAQYRAHHALGLCFEELGRFDAAIAQYREALRVRPAHARSIANLLALPGVDAGSDLVTRAQRLADSTELTAPLRARLHFGLGRYFDRQQEYDHAFTHFERSNALQKTALPPFERKALAASVDAFMREYDEAHFRAVAGSGNPSERPIFVVGMPRSGTTLVEQILASHPGVYGAGELTLMRDIARDGVVRERGIVRALAQRYLNHLESLAPQAHRVVDKMPLNFANLGLIATLFPRATIIHCRRDPLDVALSCYVETLRDLNFTTDLQDIGTFLVQKERLMSHWRKVLPLPIYELDYEKLVGAQEQETRALLAHCGLEWHESCLEHFRTERHVNTPSRWQVRQPIYASSVGRWRHYRSHLQPLIGPLSQAGLAQNL